MISKRVIRDHIYNLLTDDSKRLSQQFIWIYGILIIVSVFMSVVNLFTGKTSLMFATLAFAIFCSLNIFLSAVSSKGAMVSRIIFTTGLFALYIFFIITGIPEGFSAIWVCLLPTSGLLLYRRKKGTVVCAIMFAILVLLFQTSFGNSLLLFEYTDSFKLRFPMLYLAFFGISFFLETVRSMTYEKMSSMQEKYEYLYTHDALTGLYNRYGYNDHLVEMLRESQLSTAALMILDIDHFKKVNDEFGHINGDSVLRQISKFLLHQCNGKAEVCRWGGEEFAILYAADDAPVEFAEHLLKELREYPIKLGGRTISITASIGIAIKPSNEDATAEQLVSRADNCLYKAKDNGRDRVEYIYIST